MRARDMASMRVARVSAMVARGRKKGNTGREEEQNRAMESFVL